MQAPASAVRNIVLLATQRTGSSLSTAMAPAEIIDLTSSPRPSPKRVPNGGSQNVDNAAPMNRKARRALAQKNATPEVIPISDDDEPTPGSTKLSKALPTESQWNSKHTNGDSERETTNSDRCRLQLLCTQAYCCINLGVTVMSAQPTYGQALQVLVHLYLMAEGNADSWLI